MTNRTQRAILRTRRHKDPNPRHGSTAKRAVSTCVEGRHAEGVDKSGEHSEGLDKPALDISVPSGYTDPLRCLLAVPCPSPGVCPHSSTDDKSSLDLGFLSLCAGEGPARA
ncbi:hypothetical protein GCM10010260_16490 [Streptomyces filipinensis]|uniref:Uncharacterized protein n=1 Tax=Streptomyces filipinensis TaxID=66887 RepID=A0A918I9R5_9ACTN|nr:hypothetical protein GCM10010260_16490 [Streptomyces filipinensis]